MANDFPATVYLDCDLNELPLGEDADGNPAYIICPEASRPECFEYDGATESPPAEGCDETLTGNLAVNTNTGEVTHECACGEWRPFQVGPSPDRAYKICYDFSDVGFPLISGEGADSNWIVGGTDVLSDVTCPPGEELSFPNDVFYTCDFSQGQLAASPGPGVWGGAAWTNTGQGSGQGTIIEATGDPSDGWPCTRPSFRVDFGIPCGTTGSGPFTVTFQLEDPGGVINAALWNSCTDEYVDITSFSPVNAGAIAYVANTPLGDMLAIDTRTFTVPEMFTVEFSEVNIDPCCLNMIFTAMGNSPDNERVTGVSLEYQGVPTADNDCCRSTDNLNVAAFGLSIFDPNGQLWTVEGNSLCTTVPPGSGLETQYGLYSGCNFSVTPTVVPV